MKKLAHFILMGLVTTFCYGEPKDEMDIKKIEAITQLKGKYNELEGVFKLSAPREDVNISVDNWKMPPFMGLTSWVSFKRGQKNQTMIMGDLVLFEDEVNAVMSTALNNNLQVTALHNHFFFEKPRVFFMHIAGEGNYEVLAKGVYACFEQVKEIRKIQKDPAISFNKSEMPLVNTITPKTIEDIFAIKGESKNGMYKIVIGRTISMACGCDVGKDMGVNTWAAFAGSNTNAIVDGDFAVLESELQPVLKSLRGSGINIVAIHQHMVGENPRTLFLHYWGRDTVEKLAKAIKNALDIQSSIK